MRTHLMELSLSCYLTFTLIRSDYRWMNIPSDDVYNSSRLFLTNTRWVLLADTLPQQGFSMLYWSFNWLLMQTQTLRVVHLRYACCSDMSPVGSSTSRSASSSLLLSSWMSIVPAVVFQVFTFACCSPFTWIRRGWTSEPNPQRTGNSGATTRRNKTFT